MKTTIARLFLLLLLCSAGCMSRTGLLCESNDKGCCPEGTVDDGDGDCCNREDYDEDSDDCEDEVYFAATSEKPLKESEAKAAWLRFLATASR